MMREARIRWLKVKLSELDYIYYTDPKNITTSDADYDTLRQELAMLLREDTK